MSTNISEMRMTFDKYKNQYGFVTDNGSNTQNDILFHAPYVYLLDRFGLLTGVTLKDEIKVASQLIYKKGVLYRIGREGDQDSHDNYRAYFYVSRLLGINFAKDFLDHGRRNFWFYPCAKKPWSLKEIGGAFMFRHYDMICVAKFLNGESLSKVDQIVLAYSFNEAANAKTIESKMLKFYDARNLLSDSRIYKYPKIVTSIANWKSKFADRFPDGLGQVFYKYGRTWKSHPYVKLLKGVL